MGVEAMERLNTASSFTGGGDQKRIKVNYKTGAKFEGKLVDYKKIGHGTFIWPNGAKYEGEFSDNMRHGKGVQVWSDGSSYTGDFVNDLRHGDGSITWSNGETYAGVFFKDRRHGSGTYSWPESSSYSGTFYMDKKEGYGTFKFSNEDIFQGLYKEDEREGPGVVTYKDGSQDVGLWRGEKLIKLCSKIDGAFTIKSHPQFEYKADEHVTFIDLTSDNTALAPIEGILHPPSALDYAPTPNITQRVNELYSEALDPRSLAVDRQTFDFEFFKNLPKNSQNQNSSVKAWNASPNMMALQKHTLKHSGGKSAIKVDMDSIINLDRKNFKNKGPLEILSEELLVAAGKGDSGKVETLLNSGRVHPDVADCHGHTALIGAVVNWHIDVINVLLNQGANVNKLSDEGCSALSAGTIFYYPIEGFLYNIAEQYMKVPPELVNNDAANQDPNLRSILANNKERRASRLNQINRIKLESGGLARQVTMNSQKSDVKIKTSGANGDVEVLEDNGDEEDADSAYGEDNELRCKGDPFEEGPEDFESNQSLRNYHIEVTDQLVERCATQLSHNELVVSRENSEVGVMGKARQLAIQMSHHERMKDTLDLLLRRGADPNASSVPMPVLFFAIKSADVEMVKLLLMKGANTNAKLSPEKSCLYPIHIASAIPGEEGVQITELLLDALADPDARALEDNSFLNKTLEEEWTKDVISPESKSLLGGRTALQIACTRDDNYKNACKVVRLLLEHKANSSLMCNGFSPLALAITSGNDLAIDELLLFGADPSLPLTHGVGSALCAATTTEYEHRRSIQGRTQLVDKLIKAGANILSPIPISLKRVTGTAVDYAYYMFNQDRRIAHMPYHALTHAERETYNARRKLLGHIGDILRGKAVEREKRRNVDEDNVGMRSQSPSANFVYIGAGAKLPPGTKSKAGAKAAQGQVKFESSGDMEGARSAAGLDSQRGTSPPRSSVTVMEGVSPSQLKGMIRTRRVKTPVRKPLFKYCYECGRSVAVRLAACTRCKEVYYCSKACKLKAWNARHKEECIRVGGRSRSPSPRQKAESPPRNALGDKGKKRGNGSASSRSGRHGSSKPSSCRSSRLSSGRSEAMRRKPKAVNTDLPEIVVHNDSRTTSRAGLRSAGVRSNKDQNSLYRWGRQNLESYKEDAEKFKMQKLQRERLENKYSVTDDDNDRKYSIPPIPPLKLKEITNTEDEMKNTKKKSGDTKIAAPKRRVTLRKKVTHLPPINVERAKFQSKSASDPRRLVDTRRLANHKFRTGSPPNYNYVYIDNYSHN